MVSVAKVAAVVLLGTLTIASADVVQIPYTKKVLGWNQVLDAIAASVGLDDEKTTEAKSIATQWIFIGPCRGSDSEISGDSSGIPDIVSGADGSNPFQVAFMAMIGVLQAQDDSLGRHVSRDICRFAREFNN